eukprot:PhF_6_TR39649/c1_g1_i4/m.58820
MRGCNGFLNLLSKICPSLKGKRAFFDCAHMSLLTQEIERHAIRLRKHMNFPFDIRFKIAEYLVIESLLMDPPMASVREGGKPSSWARQREGGWELVERGLLTSKYSFTPKKLGGPLRIKFTCLMQDDNDFLCIRFCSSGK